MPGAPWKHKASYFRERGKKRVLYNNKYNLGNTFSGKLYRKMTQDTEKWRKTAALELGSLGSSFILHQSLTPLVSQFLIHEIYRTQDRTKDQATATL